MMRDELAEWVAEVEPGLFSGADALAMLDVMSDVKRLASAAETLFAARVAETDAWREGSADRSAAHWLARRTGISIAEAKAKLETAAALERSAGHGRGVSGRAAVGSASPRGGGRRDRRSAGRTGVVGYGGGGFVEGAA